MTKWAEMLIRVVRFERIQQIYFLYAVQIVQIPTKHRYNLVPRVCPLAETLAAAGHVLHPKFSVPRGCGESIKLHQQASSGILCLTVKIINFANN